ncbi:MAG TPA: hypothetical protein VIW70_00975 [Rubrivivax sp.]
MQPPFLSDNLSGCVATFLHDGSVVHMPFGDFLEAQKREAHALRRAAINAAIDAALRRLRRLAPCDTASALWSRT